MGFIRSGIKRGEFFAHGGHSLAVIVIHVPRAQFQLGHGRIKEHFGLAGFCQHQKFMRILAANRAGIRAHRNGGQPHAFIGAQVADHMAVVGVQSRSFINVKVVAVFHQKLAAPHHPEPWPHLIAELPLDVIQRQRQVFVAGHMAAENVGNHFLVRRAVQQFALLAVGNAQHFLAVNVITTAFAPKISGLQRGHQQWNVARAYLFFVHDSFDPPQHPQAQRQPRIDARRLLFDHPRPQHVAVRYDLRLGGIFFQHRQEVTGQTHRAASDHWVRLRF